MNAALLITTPAQQTAPISTGLIPADVMSLMCTPKPIDTSANVINNLLVAFIVPIRLVGIVITVATTTAATNNITKIGINEITCLKLISNFSPLASEFAVSFLNLATITPKVTGTIYKVLVSLVIVAKPPATSLQSNAVATTEAVSFTAAPAKYHTFDLYDLAWPQLLATGTEPSLSKLTSL